jgi:hypothetical protein
LSITFFMSCGARRGHHGRADEVGLAAQEGRRLQHVDHQGGGRDVLFGVHVGQHRQAQLALDLGEDLQALVAARTAEAGARGAVGLVEAALEDEGDAERAGDFLQRAGGVHLQLLGLDHTGSCDQKEGLVQPDVESAKLHATTFSACLSAT